MSISVSCSDCGKAYKVDDRFAGKRAKCKACGGALNIPAVSPTADPTGGRASSSPRASSAVSRRKAEKPAGKSGKSAGKVESLSSDVDLSSLEALESTGTVDQTAYEPVTAAEARRRKKELQPDGPAAAAAAASANRGTSYAEALANRSKGKLGRVIAEPTEAEPFSLNSLVPREFFGWFWAVIIVAGLLGLANQTMASYAAIGVVVIGLCLFFYGLTLPGILARQEDPTVYLLYRYVPGYQFYFILSRWSETSRCVLRVIQGLLLMVVGGLLVLRAGPMTIVSIFYHPDTSEQSTSGGPGRSRMATTAPEPELVAPDPASPKGVAIRFMVAMAMGDADTLSSVTYNIDPELLSADAVLLAARRELTEFAARKFADDTPPEPGIPESPGQLKEAAVKLLNAVPEQIDGETAALTPPKEAPLKFKKVDGVWKLDAGFLFGELTPGQIKLAAKGLRIEAGVIGQVIGDLSKGQYKTWQAAQTAIKDRTQGAKDADEDYLALKKEAAAGTPN